MVVAALTLIATAIIAFWNKRQDKSIAKYVEERKDEVAIRDECTALFMHVSDASLRLWWHAKVISEGAKKGNDFDHMVAERDKVKLADVWDYQHRLELASAAYLTDAGKTVQEYFAAYSDALAKIKLAYNGTKSQLDEDGRYHLPAIADAVTATRQLQRARGLLNVAFVNEIRATVGKAPIAGDDFEVHILGASEGKEPSPDDLERGLK